ncbi:MAG: hypothetical protein P8M78_12945 [Myxococcota bacterium]|nr:hypothetical protein [Myxococcota bacterium]
MTRKNITPDRLSPTPEPIRTRLGYQALCLLVALFAGMGPASAEPPKNNASAPPEAGLREQAEAAARLNQDQQSQRASDEARARQAAQEQWEAAAKQKRASHREAAAPLEEALLDQQTQQARLLRSIRGEATDGAPPLDSVPPDLRITDPRTAALSPPIRALPEEIFDRNSETVAPGTWGNNASLRVHRLTLDADGDGRPELIRFVDRQSGEIIRQEEDRNYDGILDAWTLYQSGEPTQRALDENDDGNPDAFESYQDGRVAIRELDRDDDGVRDVFYRYRGDALTEERHDANNDGVVDLVIFYEEKLRTRSEEDRDRDGRMDLWTRYVTESGLERVARIERDRGGNGMADVIDFFEARDGTSLLIRREEDLDEDGVADVVSFYVGGRLKRRQIREAPTAPM